MRIDVRTASRSFCPIRGPIRRTLVSLCMAGLFLVAVAGCETSSAKVATIEPPVVPVSQPIQREVTDYAEFTGQTKGIFSNDIIPQVTGYLIQHPFIEGAEVKKGDLLFEVDPRLYKAQLDQAQGQVDLNKASLRLARMTLARDRAINANSAGSISSQQFDQEQAVVDEALSRVDAAQRTTELYRLSYDFTKVLSPIDGQTSRYYLTKGNLVNQDRTLLTTVVSVDPMYVYFEVDEPTLDAYLAAIGKTKGRSSRDEPMPVSMQLQGEFGYPHQGSVNLVNNQSNAQTGTTLLRAVFPNPLPKGGRRLMSAGMFARVRLPISLPHRAVLVRNRAIASDQGLKYVYVVDADNKVQSRRVTAGALEEDDLRVIEDGLKPDEWIVSGALLQIRPRMQIQPERVKMPMVGQPVVAVQKTAEPTAKKSAKKSAKGGSTGPPVLPVSRPIAREITDYVDFTGQTKAIQTVDIVPMVTGYLVQMPFHEGAEVKEGDLLFVVDRRPYRAQLDQAQGQVNLYQAQLKLARTTLARDRAVNAIRPSSVSPQQIDQDEAIADEAQARVDAYDKTKEISRLNHEFTQVLSPINGQISYYRKTLGNLVTQNQTRLTTIVSVDPIYVHFEMDEPTLLRHRRALNEGKLQLPKDRTKIPVLMGLQGEQGYPHPGIINFVDNQVNPMTGSILVRGVFANPQLPGGHRLTAPGRFVRVRLPIGVPHRALLVIDRAIASDAEGEKYVYVLDAEDKVQSRRIRTGSLQPDGLRAVEEGLEPEDWVLSGGILQTRQGGKIKPERVPMPTLGSPPSGGPPAAAPGSSELQAVDKAE
jgi:membrane fusion protein, multidrug efflux system